MSEIEEQQRNGAEKRNPVKKKRRRYVRIMLASIKLVVMAAIIAGIMAGAAVTGYVSALVQDDEVRDRKTIIEQMQQNSQTGFIYFRDGTVVGQMRTEEDRRLIEYSEIPPYVETAVLATEDAEFYEHIGVDFTGLMRAVKQKLLKEDVQTGGSTITQQVARRVFLSLDKTDSRKFKEILLALRLERFMSKEDILAAYLNKIPFGNGASGYNLYGIKAAARGIFDKDLDELNIAQSAYLAGLPQQPSTFSAFTGRGEFNPEGFRLAKERQALVLSRMLAVGGITQDEYKEALSFDLQGSLAKPAQKAYSTYPYLMLEAERQAAAVLLRQNNPDLTPEQMRGSEYNEALKDARELLLRGGYKVYTTIDKDIYDTMRSISANPENFTKDHKTKGVEQVGGILIDNKTGAILGMMEGRDFYLEQLNHATQMLRQPGSAMKPIAAYLPALESGAIQPGDIVDDVPIILPDYSKGVHIPQNWDRRYHGLMTAREALNQSWNIPALRLYLEDVTIPKAWEFTNELGITTITESDYHASTGVIGGLEYGVSVEQLTNAYATIANYGTFNESFFIQRITDADDKVIYEHKVTPEKVFSEETAYLMTDMLRTVITNGTATEVKRRFEHEDKVPIVGKTGTTSDNYDLWFVGYSPDVTLGIWIGYDQPAELSESNRAKRIWAQVMNELVTSKPELFATDSFERPDGIVSKTVSAVSGLLPSELVQQQGLTVTDIFNRKFIPTKQDDVLQVANIVMVDGVSYLPQPGTPEDMTRKKQVVMREEPISALMKRIQEAISKQSPADRRPLSSYMPTDGFGDAPAEVDPRVEDGNNPTAPPKLTLIKTENGVKVMFAQSPNRDIAGYRVFRSHNGGPFQQLPEKTVLNGDGPSFYDEVPSDQLYGYYVVAVDIAGRISSPSETVFTGESFYVPLPGGMDDLTENESGGAGDNGEFNPDSQSEPNRTGGQQTADGNSVPSVPQRPTAEASELGVRLTWASNPADESVSRYNVYYTSERDGIFRPIGSTTGTEFEYISLPSNGWYRITAQNDKGESLPSPSVSFQP